MYDYLMHITLASYLHKYVFMSILKVYDTNQHIYICIQTPVKGHHIEEAILSLMLFYLLIYPDLMTQLF